MSCNIHGLIIMPVYVTFTWSAENRLPINIQSVAVAGRYMHNGTYRILLKVYIQPEKRSLCINRISSGSRTDPYSLFHLF